MANPNEWLADFEARAAAAKEKAEKFQESLGSAGASASSKDGLVTVTVAPNGSLADLRISDAALSGSGLRGSGAGLAAEILRTAREAQRRAAGNVLTAFTALGGADSEATKMLTGFVPPPEPPDPGSTDPQLTEEVRFLPPVEQEPREPRREPPVRPVRRTPRPAEEDDDSGGSVLGSTDW